MNLYQFYININIININWYSIHCDGIIASEFILFVNQHEVFHNDYQVQNYAKYDIDCITFIVFGQKLSIIKLLMMMVNIDCNHGTDSILS